MTEYNKWRALDSLMVILNAGSVACLAFDTIFHYQRPQWITIGMLVIAGISWAVGRVSYYYKRVLENGTV